MAPLPQRLGRYTLLELLGTGGMAEVWKARIDGPGGFQRNIVIKRLLPHLSRDPGFVEMFFAEARLYSLLDHPNIVQVYELGHEGDVYFMAMEHVRGCDVIAVLRSLHKGLPPFMCGLAAYTVREVCRALAYAHGYVHESKGPLRIVHRDVSPSNIMLSYDGRVKLLDFGIAKALSATDNLTQPGMLKGKFAYMSPQQAEGRPIDHRADLFAAGIVLHEMISGKRLFKAPDHLLTLAIVREAKVEKPSQNNPEASAELDRICLKALARLENDRYQSADEMADDLDKEVARLAFGATQTAALVAEVAGPKSFSESLPPLRLANARDERLTPEPTASVVEGDVMDDSVSVALPSLAPPRRTALWAATAVGVALLGTILIVTVRGKPTTTVVAPQPPLGTAPIATVPIEAPSVGTVPVATAPLNTAPVATPPVAAPPVATPPIAAPPVAPPTPVTGKKRSSGNKQSSGPSSKRPKRGNDFDPESAKPPG